MLLLHAYCAVIKEEIVFEMAYKFSTIFAVYSAVAKLFLGFPHLQNLYKTKHTAIKTASDNVLCSTWPFVSCVTDEPETFFLTDQSIRLRHYNIFYFCIFLQ